MSAKRSRDLLFDRGHGHVMGAGCQFWMLMLLGFPYLSLSPFLWPLSLSMTDVLLALPLCDRGVCRIAYERTSERIVCQTRGCVGGRKHKKRWRFGRVLDDVAPYPYVRPPIHSSLLAPSEVTIQPIGRRKCRMPFHQTREDVDVDTVDDHHRPFVYIIHCTSGHHSRTLIRLASLSASINQSPRLVSYTGRSRPTLFST